MSYPERIKHKSHENLSFYMIDCNLNERTYHFHSDKIENKEYYASVINSDAKGSGMVLFLNPIKEEFKRLKG